MAGFRPTQVVIGIAGELVKGFTTTHSQERKRPDQPISEAELQKLIDGVQREALSEAERAITWETGLPHVDVRLVHAAVTGAAIDGYALTNPVGFQGRHVKIGIFNAFAPLVHLGALQSVASQLDLELLEIVAEPYAVARVLGSDQVRQAGALFVDVGGGTTDVALVRQGGIEGTRMFALGGRAFTKSIADRLDLPFPRAESLKVDYAKGLSIERRDDIANIIGEDVRVWAAGVELVMEELSGGDLLPGRIFLCGGGSRLPEIPAALAAESFWKRMPFARPPEVTVLSPDQIETVVGRDRPARRPTGRHAARAGLPGDRAPDVGGSPRRRPAARASGDEGLPWPDRASSTSTSTTRSRLGGGPRSADRGGAGGGRAAVRIAGRDLADQLPAPRPRRLLHGSACRSSHRTRRLARWRPRPACRSSRPSPSTRRRSSAVRTTRAPRPNRRPRPRRRTLPSTSPPSPPPSLPLLRPRPRRCARRRRREDRAGAGRAVRLPATTRSPPACGRRQPGPRPSPAPRPEPGWGRSWRPRPARSLPSTSR